MFPLFRLLLLLASAAVASSGPVTFRAHALHVRAPLVRANVRASSADPGSGDEAPASTEEWRSFRARLVAQEAKEQAASAESPEGEVPLADGPSDGWIIELPIIEEGSVILASTQQRHGFGLHQQYFHKCAMLVLSHGPEFTRGIILNRPTPFRTDEGWPLWYGGDVQSLTEEREAREITCIHTLDLPAAEKMSLRVTPEISYTSYEGAKELVAQGVAQPSDFWTFCGYAGWGPGQLQSELDRKTGSSWRLVSANGAVLLRELIGQRRGGATADDGGDGGGDGIDTWERLMRGIGQGVSEVDATSGGFADRMLREWIRVNLRPLAPTPALTVAAVAASAKPEGARSPVVLEEGSVLRSAAVHSSFTLGRQYLHKALVLLLRAGRQGSVGLVLNRPSAGHVAFPKSGKKRQVLFGGQLSLRDANVLWFHRSTNLAGEPIGASGIFRTSSDSALAAIARGNAVESDFLCVHGVLAWGAGGLEREVAAGRFVPVVMPEHVPWDAIWKLAEPEGQVSAKAGVGSAGGDAWEHVRAAEPAEILGGLESEVADGDEELADTALLKWVDSFLSS